MSPQGSKHSTITPGPGDISSVKEIDALIRNQIKRMKEHAGNRERGLILIDALLDRRNEVANGSR